MSKDIQNAKLRKASEDITHLSVPQVARRIGASRSLIYEMLKDGRLKARKLGARTLIPAVEIDNFMARLPAYGEQP